MQIPANSGNFRRARQAGPAFPVALRVVPEPAESLISIADYEAAAEAVLSRGAHGYFDGGAADEITMRDNLAAWARIAVPHGCWSASASATPASRCSGAGARIR